MSKIKKVLILMLSLVVAVFCFAGCNTGIQDEPPKKTDEILDPADEEILKYYHEPTIDENFEDNRVNVILKSSYSHITEIGFEDFEIVEEVAEITSITYKLETIKREDGVKLSFQPLKAGYNHLIYLELATHDKGKVLEVIAQLKKLDMVLVSEPDYIYDIEK